MTTLTKQDKLQIISSHIRNLEYRKYGLELDIIVEEAKTTPISEVISKHQESLDEISNQMAALNTELAAINALAE